jgi:hypothetical protein
MIHHVLKFKRVITLTIYFVIGGEYCINMVKIHIMNSLKILDFFKFVSS